MAANDHQVVTIEPQQLQQATNFATGNVDENGEQIIMEGVCHRSSMFSDIIWAMVVVSLTGLGMLLAIPIGLCCACAAVKAWRLYLTRNAIHYRHMGLCFSCRTFIIPLSYVKDIKIEFGTKNVLLLMDRSNAYEFITCGERPMYWFCCPPENCYVTLKSVANCEEFANAVKREIAA